MKCCEALQSCVAAKPALRVGALQVGALRVGALQDWCRGFEWFPGNSRAFPEKKNTGFPGNSREFVISRDFPRVGDVGALRLRVGEAAAACW